MAFPCAAREREWVILQKRDTGTGGWAPAHLGDLLRKWFWKEDRPAIPMRKVWQDMCKYLYLPRLQSEEVFLQTVRDGLEKQDWFAYAAREKAPGVYEGLMFGEAGQIYMDDSSVLLHSDAAAKAQPTPAPESDGPTVIGCGPSGPDQPSLPVGPKQPGGKPTPAQKEPRRFHGTVTIPNADPMGEFMQVVDNVIQFFSIDVNTELTLRLDIEARRPGGFDQRTVRIVKENANTLKFMSADFEDE